MEQCFAFAVHGFVPGSLEEQPRDDPPGGPASLPKWAFSDRWVFSDLDAMKYLLLNHQVWDLRRAGPELPLRLLSFLNGLVAAHSAHAAFNSRRLHLLGIIRWTLHLMLEAAELYSAGAVAAEAAKSGGLDVSGTDADFGGDGMNAPGFQVLALLPWQAAGSAKHRLFRRLLLVAIRIIPSSLDARLSFVVY